MSEQKRLSQIVKLVGDKAGERKDPTLAYVGMEHIRSGETRLCSFGKASDSVSTNNVFRKGDTLFGKLRPRLHKCVVAPFDGYCSTDILVFRARDGFSPSFCSYRLASHQVFAEAVRVEEGTKMPRCSWKDLQDFKVFCPSEPKQKKIARILTTLGNLIEKTEALIAKYQAIKQGMMHDLFTRGVDEHGQLRPTQQQAPDLYKQSELGWIPKDWDEVTLGDELKGIEQGWSPDCDSIPARAGQWGVLKTTSVVWDGYADWENKVLPPTLEPRKEYEVKVGDILMTRGGPNSRVGVVVYVYETQSRLMMSDKLYRIVPNAIFDREYLVLALSSDNTQMHLSTLKTGLAESQTNISQVIVRRLLVPRPEKTEQEEIAKRLRSITTLIQAEQRALAKRKLQKTGLMQDLLTGKVRVKVDEAEEVAAHA